MSAILPMRQQISLYLEDLLAAQYKVSSKIEHRPTKGELREDFIKKVVCDQYDGKCFYKGILEIDGWQSPEIDFIWLKQNARIGSFHLYDGRDCKLYMEIKSAAQKDEIVYLNNYTRDIKSRCIGSTIKAGMFCYSTHSNKKSVLKDFGFSYDRTLKAFKGYEKSLDSFPNIDFIYGLDLQNKKREPYFVMRDYYGNNTLFLQEPVIDLFLDMFKD